jgi:uncharacterized membrane protein YeaQ/YmgE (transglycosylase-associated protein family)
MVSPEHIDEQKLEDQHAPTVVENKRAWLKHLMRVVLGVVVPLIGGFTCMYLTINVAGGFLLGWIVGFFVGIVGAVLLRSRWAILVVPIACILGEWLVVPQLFGVDFFKDLNFGSFLYAFAGPILALLGSFISIRIVKKAQEPGLTTMPKDF